MLSSLDKFDTVVFDETEVPDQVQLHTDIVSSVITTYKAFYNNRKLIENEWLSCWASYLNTTEAEQHIRDVSVEIIGKVKSQWRHKIKTGKAFEIVETLHSYFMQAFFPSAQWFDIEAKKEGYEQLALILRYYMSNKFDEWLLKDEWSSFIRQLIITGSSVIAIPWSGNKVEYETLDIFDCYYNPTVRNFEETPFIRKVVKTRAELAEGLKAGTYSNISLEKIVKINPANNLGMVKYDTASQTLKRFRGVDVPDFSWSDKLTTLEYWGDIQLPYMTIKNALVHIVGGEVIRFEPNTYECGKPFVVGTYIPVIRQMYGIGAIQTSLSLLTGMNNSLNQLLDGTELAVTPMYTYIQGQTISPEDIETEPGKLIPVESHDAIRPITPPLNNFNLSFQQIGTFEQSVNQITGLGPLLGVGQPRGGERVTAAEIQAVVEAGGNRQLGVYTHMRQDSFTPLLQKTIKNVRQFTNFDDTVRIDDTSTGRTYFIDIGPEELNFEYELKPKGAEHVVQKEEIVNRKRTVLELALQLPPEQQQQVDLLALFTDIVRTTLYEDPQKYIIQTQEQEELPLPDVAEEGSPAQQQFLQEQLIADGGQNFVSNLLGEDIGANTAAAIESGAATQPI